MVSAMSSGRARRRGPSKSAAPDASGRPVDPSVPRLPQGLELFEELRRFDSIDSTNGYLLAEARRGARQGLVVVADHQSAGRGRLGRSWEAPPGSSLLVSVLLRPDLPPGRAQVLGLVMALAASDACDAATGLRPALKWPNDLVVEDRKLGGVLSETELEGPLTKAVVVGLGLNLRWPGGRPEGVGESATTLDDALRAAEARGLRTRGRDSISRDGLLAELLRALEVRLATLSGAGPEQLLSEYRSLCATLGRSVRVELPGRTLEGFASGVDSEGRLLVQDTGSVHVVAVGDVVHVREARRLRW